MAVLMRKFNCILRNSHVHFCCRNTRCFSTNDNGPQASLKEDEPVQRKSEKPINGFSRDGQRPGADNKFFAPPEYRFIYPEFLPDTEKYERRNHLMEKLERFDMLKRRRVIDIPEFYVGSIIAITASDKCAPGKQNRFLGICIHRNGAGLRAQCHLRNVVDHQGVEIGYDLYNPTIQKIEVIKLEKRLDDSLYYLRDALPEYSTFPFDMAPVPHPEGVPVPINPIKVKLKPRPWHGRWHHYDIKGIQDSDKDQHRMYFDRKIFLPTPWEKYDLMKEYRRLIPEEQQQEIYADVYEHQKQFEKIRKKAKKTFLHSNIFQKK